MDWLERHNNVQSMQFMIDCLPFIRELLSGWPSEQTVRVLDAGTGSGAGANLLGHLYSGHYPPRMVIDAVELTSYMAPYARANFPYINYITADLAGYRPPEPYDLVICSHVIEHVPDPLAFISSLSRLSRHWVLFYAPWQERDLIPGHETRIDSDFLSAAGAVRQWIVDSRAWGPCVAFTVPGTAGGNFLIETAARGC